MKHDDEVIFKGTKEGLWLILDEQVDYGILRNRLREKLQETADFFLGAKVRVNHGKRKLQISQYHEISDVLQKEFGMVLLQWDAKDKSETAKKQSVAVSPVPVEKQGVETLVVYKTVRSGQRINHEGSVLVLGDVNPGGSIVAGGDITILGVCRGAAHAGASGNIRAAVAAYRLQPTQLRISNIIACAPDGANAPEFPEVACIKDGEVTIEAAILR
jgi:septum site-determining protein MinC